MCVCVCVQLNEGNVGAPGVAVQVIVNRLMKVLETEPRSSTREVCTFNCRTISPVLFC